MCNIKSPVSRRNRYVRMNPNRTPFSRICLASRFPEITQLIMDKLISQDERYEQKSKSIKEN